MKDSWRPKLDAWLTMVRWAALLNTHTAYSTVLLLIHYEGYMVQDEVYLFVFCA